MLEATRSAPQLVPRMQCQRLTGARRCAHCTVEWVRTACINVRLLIGYITPRFHLKRAAQGPGYVAVLEWQEGDSAHPHFVPQFAVCFEKRDLVDPSRVMECGGKDVEIFQYAPDDLYGADGQKFVDLKDNMFVIVGGKKRAS